MLIGKVLSDALKFLAHDITPQEIPELSDMYLSSYWYLKIDEVILILKNGIAGNYGKTYGKFTYAVWAEWTNNYFNNERNDYFYAMNCKKSPMPDWADKSGRGSDKSIKDIIRGIEP